LHCPALGARLYGFCGSNARDSTMISLRNYIAYQAAQQVPMPSGPYTIKEPVLNQFWLLSTSLYLSFVRDRFSTTESIAFWRRRHFRGANKSK
jgi:hypothetical protein